MRPLTQSMLDNSQERFYSATVNDRGHVWLHEALLSQLTYDDINGAWVDENGDYGIPYGSDYDASDYINSGIARSK